MKPDAWSKRHHLRTASIPNKPGSGGFAVYLSHTAEHLRTHVHQDHTFRANRREMRSERRQVEMVLQCSVREIALGDKVRLLGSLGEFLNLFSVAGIAECLAVDADAQRIGRGGRHRRVSRRTA